MVHRHLNTTSYSLAAIDDVIARGRRKEWEALRDALASDVDLADKVRSICLQKIDDPYAQRYHFWFRYVQQANA